MSLSLDCAFGMFKAGLPVPALPLRFGGQPLGFFLERASRPASGLPGIQLRTAAAYSPRSLRPASVATDLLNLHVSLASMLGNPVDGRRIARVGVLYADALLGHPDLFGLMFDEGFAAPGIPGAFPAVPREGCVVFLSAVARHRPQPQHFVLETLFTTAHELSHVFNLWHVAERSFLANSDLRVPPFGPESYGYVPVHADFLRNMDRPEVFPGGTPFGVRGLLGPAEANPQNAPASEGVRIRLSTNVRECWRFEPLELTVRISPTSDAVVLPDEIDPGYDTFDLWITEPDGVRRRYRSTARYCTNAGTITLTRGSPFERDIPIFGQAGGYTFRKAGVHRVLATLRLPQGGVVRSNEVEVELREARPRSAEYVRLRELLTQRSAAQLLFYKSASRSTRALSRTLNGLTGLRNSSVRASVRYASGLALMKRPAGRRAADHERAAALLKAALDSGHLGQHQVRKARKYLEE